ncbi:MAG: T9SS type A sorting domain-containing protein [Melioribacteraceae bacterium]|nr:T9SS type A sorting domain-containing protein [Melioribacteraceae bacterium]WKZ69411.1 MAG: T9SS type A sorting domain-containing protein [Melioribacteraceae bacterium]
MKIIILFFLFVLISRLCLGQNEIDTGLIAHYPLNGNAIDISGNNLHGDLIGTQSTHDRFGNFGSAVFFNGENDFINLGSSNLLKPYPPITIAVWVNYASLPAVIWGNDFNETIYYGLRLLVNQNNIIDFSYCNGLNIGPNARKTVMADIHAPNQWVHIAGTIDINYNMQLYINGIKADIEQSGYAESLVYSDGPAVFGMLDSQTYGPPYFLNGRLDDFRLYNRVLTDREIRALVDGWDNSKNFLLSIDNVLMDNPNQIEVPVYFTIPDNKTLNSFEIDIEGFQDDVNFHYLLTENSDVLTSDWGISVYSTSEGISIAGATEISSGETRSGLFFNLIYSVEQPILENKIVPLIVTKAIVNNNSSYVETINGSITVYSDEITYGDVDLDGQVRALDASYILEYLIGGIEFNNTQFLSADVTLDSTVSGLDANIILDYLTGKVQKLPYTPDSNHIAFTGKFYMDDIVDGESALIELPIYLETQSNTFSVEGEIEFDNKKFELISVRWGKKYSNFSTTYSNNNGLVSFALFGNTIPGSDTLLTFILSNKVFVENSVVSLDRVRVNESKNQFNVASSILNMLTDVKNEVSLLNYTLDQNYPNPFNPSTTISFTIPNSEHVSLEIFDVLGRKISTLVNSKLAAGNHAFTFHADEYNSGLYLYRITSGDFIDVRKMILIK